MVKLRVSISWERTKFKTSKIFLKINPFAKRLLLAKRIIIHVLSHEFQALSAQPWYLRLIISAKLAKVKLSQNQFELNSAKLQPDR